MMALDMKIIVSLFFDL